MVDVDFREFRNGEFVLHFGGRTNEIDVYTFSNSLSSVCAAIQEINKQINPDIELTITLDAFGAGSFRARLKTSVDFAVALFKSRYSEAVILGVLGNYIFGILNPADKIQIIIHDNSYIVQQVSERIVLPREFPQAEKRIKEPELIKRHISRTFKYLENDRSVTNFGFATHISAPEPTFSVPRAEFAILSRSPEEDDPAIEVKEEITKVVVIKAIFERGSRRWQFAWNGVKISAPIRSRAFFDKIAAGEYEFGQGDVLIVTLRIVRVRDELTRAFLNKSYEIIEVHGLEKSPKQSELGSSSNDSKE
jgi:hypothetical protein